MRRIPRLAAYTFRLQWPASVLLGMSQGVFWLSAFVVKRSLGAPDVVVYLLIALFQVSWILAPTVGPLLSRADPQRTWRLLAPLAHVPVLLVALVAVTPTGARGHGEGGLALFSVAVGLYYAVGIAYVPHRGALLRANYAPHVRGWMYGLIGGATLLGAVLMNKLAGILLDSDPRWLRLLFPVAALLGLSAFLVLSRIRWRGQKRAGRAPRTGLRDAWREAFSILRNHRDFRTYEIAFMTYGFGFLMSVPLLTLYGESNLNLSYHQWTWAQGVAYPVALTLFLPFWGRLVDRLGVVRSTAVAFLLLGLFFGTMPFVTGPLGLVAAFSLWGLAMAGVDVGWSLGPLHYAPDGKAHMYAAIHFCLVGVRSLVAPMLGYLVRELFSFRAAFGLSALLEVAALAVLWRLSRRCT